VTRPARQQKKRELTRVGSRKATPLFGLLLQVKQRVASSTTLTFADQSLIGVLLDRIARDEDPRSAFWETVENRPPTDDGGVKWNAVFVYEARLALTPDSKRKCLAGEVADLAGISVNVLKHARHDHEVSVRKFIALLDKDHLKQLLEARQCNLLEMRGRK
jgi:hypothetical protein